MKSTAILVMLVCIPMLEPGGVHAKEQDLAPSEFRLQPGQPQVVPLANTAGQYWHGELNSDSPVKVQLVDKSQKTIREFPSVAGKQSLHLMLDAAGQQLQLQSQTATKVYLLWRAKYPRVDQKSTEPDEPLLQQITKSVQTGADWRSAWLQLKQQDMPLKTRQSDGSYRVTFIYQGAKRNVRLLGGPSSDHDWLTPIAGTDLWYRSYVVPSSTRLSYKLAPDVPDIQAPARAQRVAILATAKRDPLNPVIYPADETDPYQQSSVLVLPEAPEQPGSDASIALTGKMDSDVLTSKLLGNSRTITVYHSSNFVKGKAGNIRLLAFDGPKYQRHINTPAIVEYLSQKGLIPPVQLVLIDPIDNETRAAELPDNIKFGQMLIKELLPQLERKYGSFFNAGETILTGSSFGGLAALQLAWRHPQIFGNVIAQSPSLWWDNRQEPAHGTYLLSERFLASELLPLQIFISAGIYESAHGAQGDKGILDGSRNLKDVLRAKGYQVTYREYAAGHDYSAWRGALADGLIALFPVAAN